MANPKLNQIVAVVSGKKTDAQKVLTEAHNHRLKPDGLSGLTRNYKPLKEDGEQLPSEIKVVQVTVPQVIKEVAASLNALFDAVLTQDVGNTQAKATVKVEGRTILADVPVTYLMFLEKQLVDLETFLSKLPVLDPSGSRSRPGLLAQGCLIITAAWNVRPRSLNTSGTASRTRPAPSWGALSSAWSSRSRS